MKQMCALVFTLVFVSSCTTASFQVKESMMANGHWAFEADTSDSCQILVAQDGKSDQSLTNNIPILSKKSLNEVVYPENYTQAQCIEVFKRRLISRSKELCGHENYTLYGCLNTTETHSSRGILLFGSNEPKEAALKCYLNCSVSK